MSAFRRYGFNNDGVWYIKKHDDGHTINDGVDTIFDGVWVTVYRIDNDNGNICVVLIKYLFFMYSSI